MRNFSCVYLYDCSHRESRHLILLIIILHIINNFIKIYALLVSSENTIFFIYLNQRGGENNFKSHTGGRTWKKI